MKKISLVLLIFLLSLCLIPPTSAVYGDEALESILSFSETLPDDVMYFPDLFENTTSESATTGTYTGNGEQGTWANTKVKDGTIWRGSILPYTMELEFDGEVFMYRFDYAFYFTTVAGSADLDIYNYTSSAWDEFDEVDTSSTWYNGTVYNPDYWDGSESFKIQIYCPNDGTTAYWDYAEVRFSYMHLADSDHYAESFSDVADWSLLNTEAGETFTTDGDVGSFECAAAGADADMIFTDDPSLATGRYVEFRYKVNDTEGYGISFYAYQADGPTPPTLNWGLVKSTSWITRKILITIPVESIVFRVDHAAANTLKFEIDYLRISPTNESGGWQHDGSITQGITEYSGSISSDGDQVTVSNVSGDAGAGIFFFDTTSTIAKSEDTHYPFVSISVTTAEAGTRWSLGYATTDTPSVWGDFSWWIVDETTTGTFRVNLASLSLGTSNIAVLSQDGAITVDHIKIYSIANFTVSQGSVGVDEYAYVDSGILYVQKDTTNWMSLGNDIPKTVAVASYPVWNISTSDIDPRGDEGSSFRFTSIVGGVPENHNDEARGDYEDTGILTDFTLIFYVNELMDISAIKFIDTHDWQDVGEARFIFPIGWDPTFQFGYDSFFIFLGLIMIPVSTMYLVRGGRKEMSADKLFYGLIIFAVGFGLLVGGIMP